jgi:hypothetical protein
MRARKGETMATSRKVVVKASALNVYVDGVRVGHVTDCGDCWRGGVFGARRRRARLYNVEFDSRADAVRGVVAAAAK